MDRNFWEARLKYPYLQFYPGDWLKDPALSLCSPATRGVWIDLLCAMHEMDRSGVIAGTREQLAQVCRCQAVHVAEAIEELNITGAADVTERNGVVTVACRRMKREAKERKDGMLRVKKHRSNASVTPSVTEMKQTHACTHSEDEDDSEDSSKGGSAEGRGKELSPLAKRIGAWFGRRESTVWSEREIRQLKVVEAMGTPEEDVALLERRYVGKEPYIRRDILTLLNNWPGEIDRAKAPPTNGVKKIQYGSEF